MAERQAGALTSEDITPEMIEAAAEELAGFNEDFATLSEGAESILRVALRVKAARPPSPCPRA